MLFSPDSPSRVHFLVVARTSGGAGRPRASEALPRLTPCWTGQPGSDVPLRAAGFQNPVFMWSATEGWSPMNACKVRLCEIQRHFTRGQITTEQGQECMELGYSRLELPGLLSGSARNPGSPDGVQGRGVLCSNLAPLCCTHSQGPLAVFQLLSTGGKLPSLLRERRKTGQVWVPGYL